MLGRVVQWRGFSSVIVAMPKLSPTMRAGRVATWLVNAGDLINAHDVIAHIDADDVFDASAGGITGRVEMLLETHDDGVVAEVLVAAGGPDVPAGTPVALVAEDEEDVEAFRRRYHDSASRGGDADEIARRIGARVMAWQAYLHAAAGGIS